MNSSTKHVLYSVLLMLGVSVSALVQAELSADVHTNSKPNEVSDQVDQAASATQAKALQFLGRYSTGVFDGSAAEISAYDADTQRLLVVDGHHRAINVVDINDPTQPVLIQRINMLVPGYMPNSVAVANGVVAVAVEAVPKQKPGQVDFYDAKTYQLLGSHVVGSGPDMLTFTPDYQYVVVANEGEPNEAYTVDPPGSITIIDLSQGLSKLSSQTAAFTQFNGQDNSLREQGVRLTGPKASVAQDLEPEYVAISADSTTAWVTLQENNAIAVVDIATAEVQRLIGLGYQDHNQAGYGFDASDKDRAIRIRPWPVLGMFQPDAVVAHQIADETYLLMANEGEMRDYEGYSDAARVADLDLDTQVFSPADQWQQKQNLGRLYVSTDNRFAESQYKQLYSFGTRSFSIRATSGELLWDSGSDFAEIIAKRYPANFNANNDSNRIDKRSDNKGVEPEGIAVTSIKDRTYAFIGLERMGGVMVYEVTNPLAPRFVDYQLDRDFAQDPEDNLAAAGDLGPEGLLIIKAADSPIGHAMLVVTNEVSGTVSLYQINL